MSCKEAAKKNVSSVILPFISLSLSLFDYPFSQRKDEEAGEKGTKNLFFEDGEP